MLNKRKGSPPEASGDFDTNTSSELEAVMAEEAFPPKKPRLSAAKAKLSSGFRRFGGWYMRTPGSHLLACFGLPAIMMVLIYSLIGTFPIGPSSVLVLDLNGQYVYFFEALRDWVWGDGSLLYSFSRQLGGEFLGIYAYYIASPLSYIVALFPKVMITEALYFIFVLKCGLSGLSFGYYMYRTKRASQTTTVIFSVLYALSAYAVVMQHNTMWIDNLFLLPMVALGIDLMISEGKYKLFTFSLIFAVMSNYYIGYMTCIFVFLYFFYSFFSRSREERNPHGKRFHFIRSITRIGIFSAIALGIASLIIIPAYYSLTFGKNDFSEPNFEVFLRYDLLDLLSKCFFGSYDTVRPEGLPFIYCGTVVFFTLPLYFVSKKVRIREKFCGALLAFVFIASFLVNTVDMVWHGFQAPNWLNYRYSFMFCFVILVMAARGFDNFRALTVKTVTLVGSFLALFLLLFQKFDLLRFNSDMEWLDATLPLLLNAILITVWVLVLHSLIRNKKGYCRRQIAALLSVLIFAEAILGGVMNLAQLSVDVTISWRRSYRNFVDRWQDPMDEVMEADASLFYRMEQVNHRKVNDPFALGYRGLSGSSSTLNADTIEYLYMLGISSRSHWTEYVDSCPVIDSFLSVKYVFAESDDPVSRLYKECYNDGDVTGYLNPYALPIAYGVSANVKDITFIAPKEDEIDEDGNIIPAPVDDREYIDTTSAPLRLNQLMGTLLGRDEPIELFRQLKYSIDFYNDEGYNNTDIGFVVDHKFYSRKDEDATAYINYSVDNPGPDKEVYCYIPTLYLRDVDLLVNGEKVGKYMSNGTHGITSLGYFEEGEDIKVTLSISDEGTYLGNAKCYFFYLDEGLLTETMSELAYGGYELEEFDEDRMSGRINVAEGKETIFTSIPYDAGWKVTCDGHPVETFEVLDAVLAFELPVGEHELTLTYMPDEYKLALGISSVSCVIFGIILCGDRFIVSHRRKKEDTEE